MIIGSDSGFQNKPSSEGIEHIISKSNRENCIFVGDAYTDYIAASRAGLKFIFCAYGYDLVDCKYENVIYSFEELNEQINDVF